MSKPHSKGYKITKKILNMKLRKPFENDNLTLRHNNIFSLIITDICFHII